MTQDEIIEMGRQALSDAYGSGDMFKFLERFAKLVAQHEREKFCAVLRQLHDSYSLASDSSDIKAGDKHDSRIL
jgi:hypothetical protein